VTQHDQAERQGQAQHPPQEGVRERKQRVLTKRTPSIVRSIADAIVIKDEDLFFLAQPDGSVPLKGQHGYGLYYHDCRFLNGYEIKIAGTRPEPLAATAAGGFTAIFQLSNPDISMSDGALLPKEHLGITWERTIDSDQRALYDLLTLENYELEPIELPLTLTFTAAFEDVFSIRGLLPARLGHPRPPQWKDGTLSLVYDGADGHYRSVSISFSPPPESTDGTTAHFRVRLGPDAQAQVLVALHVAESPNLADIQPRRRDQPDIKAVQAYVQASSSTWLDYQTEVRSDNPVLNQIMDRSLRDLRVLRGRLDKHEFFSAGVPWFATLFGRDSLISALETLAYAPDMAAHTLRLLASYQADQVDEWRDAQPGKILHELRVGELARLNEIPQVPYYGTIDATLLFLIVLGRHAAWTGDISLFNELRSNVERALDWMAQYGDPRGWGYITYESTSDKGLINQGWKDSGDAIVNADGSLATPPIALVEVQGYAYLAKRAIADLYERAGAPERARQLRAEADDLRARFKRDFWLPDEQILALALQDGKRPVAVRSSNPGQALWSGIIDRAAAQATADMLMADDMFNGWGVRTLSSKERRYNPIGYHLGTVWPHDNAIIAAGLKRYGFDDAFRRIFGGIAAAASHFGNARLPELFAGFTLEEYGIPVHYPVACHPQAWAAGAVPFLVETALGLTPEAFERRLRIIRPLLPQWTSWLEVRRLKVGNASVDLRFERAGQDMKVDVLKVDGGLEVLVEPGESAPEGAGHANRADRANV
jgi:glycogen debranching enzyme